MEISLFLFLQHILEVWATTTSLLGLRRKEDLGKKEVLRRGFWGEMYQEKNPGKRNSEGGLWEEKF